MEKIKTSQLATSHIRTDGGTQTREELDESVVAEYAEAMAAGAKFPPCVVFYDGVNNWLADGFHRFYAAVKNKKTLLCEQHNGSKRDAIFYSTGANGAHGLRRSNQTKRNQVTILLNDVEWNARADGWIASHCIVSPHTVAAIRKELSLVGYANAYPNERITRDGREISTENRGRPPATQAPQNFAADNAQNDEIEEPTPDAFDDETPESETDLEGYGEDGSTPVVDGYGRPVVGHLAGIKATATTETMHSDLPEETKPERMTKAQEDALPDNEWLEILPLRAKLIEEKIPERLFEEAALLWRVSQKPLNELRRVINGRVNVRSGDPYTMRVRTYIDTPHPNQWKFSRGETGGFLLW